MNQDHTSVDTITAHLRKTEPFLTDNPFTTTVMAQLPCTRKLPGRKKNTLLLAVTTLGSAIAASQIPVTFVPDLLDTAAADWSTLLGTGVMLAYSTAIAAIWAARRQ
ncbi:MAG: hypothetical protein QF483_06120 [Gammaproteobacteria bacterium]|jgi:hypothetical protein|nr:hypothetical protein [Chromatiales bacterium]MCP4925515.1 hypothetical protein [Gammaproteobacteria bacterium]MDP7419438.1 hypothetical protein [Gammaproteobacteria bacterium]HJP39540.1 hypothetical protein [Gammaproteobacteria bacterium]